MKTRKLWLSLLTALVFATFLSGSVARASGTWSSTSSMSTDRVDHTATLLADGRVLVAGGYADGYQALFSAQVYDPVTGNWDDTGNMSTGRYRHTATPLMNGKVLVAGGYVDGNNLSSAELYDPEAGIWISTSGMSKRRYGHTATLLVDGRVLVAGAIIGEGWNQDPSCEIYDPSSGIWNATGSMNIGRFFQTATLLSDGRMLAVGGVTYIDFWDNDYHPTSSVEVYTPTEQYTLTASPSLVVEEETITVNWSAPFGHSATDWIGMYYVGAPGTSLISWQYTGSGASGSMAFTAPYVEPYADYGHIEFRYFTNDTYNRVATSNTVDVFCHLFCYPDSPLVEGRDSRRSSDPPE